MARCLGFPRVRPYRVERTLVHRSRWPIGLHPRFRQRPGPGDQRSLGQEYDASRAPRACRSHLNIPVGCCWSCWSSRSGFFPGRAAGACPRCGRRSSWPCVRSWCWCWHSRWPSRPGNRKARASRLRWCSTAAEVFPSRCWNGRSPTCRPRPRDRAGKRETALRWCRSGSTRCRPPCPTRCRSSISPANRPIFRRRTCFVELNWPRGCCRRRPPTGSCSSPTATRPAVRFSPPPTSHGTAGCPSMCCRLNTRTPTRCWSTACWLRPACGRARPSS